MAPDAPGRAEAEVCPRCHGELNSDSVFGLCGRCLLEQMKGGVGENSRTSAPLKAGTVVGNYELIQQIAAGGMGVVFKAKQLSAHGRIVALKMIRGERLAWKEGTKDRFIREARIAAQLNHPYIVPIYEVGELPSNGLDSEPFFSMEYVEGKTLAELLVSQPLKPEEAAELALMIAQAVHYAQERGVLHRDLKPANILIDVHKRPRITDFGLAKELAAPAGHVGVTRDGQVLGTPEYMAPEQAKGNPNLVGREADVYSIGCILYHMVVGRPPHQAATPLETLELVCTRDPVPPRQLNPRLPRDLETICLHCLEKDATKRYRTASELRSDLECFLEGRPIKARPTTTLGKWIRWARRRPALSSLAVALVLTLVTASCVSWNLFLRAESARRSLFDEIQRDQVLRAHELAANGRPRDAMSLLANALRRAPSNDVISDRLLSLLHQRNWPLARGEASLGQPLLNVFAQTNGAWLILGVSNLWDWNLATVNLPGVRFRREPQRVLALPPTLEPDTLLARSRGEAGQGLALWAGGKVTPTGNPTSAVMLEAGSKCELPADFSSSGGRVAARLADGRAGIWEIASGKRMFSIPVATGVAALSFDADGNRLILAGVGKEAEVWDVRSQQPLAKLIHNQNVESVSLSGDGLRAATATIDRVVQLWDVHSGEPLSEPFSVSSFHPEGVSLDYSGSGLMLWTRSGQLTVLDFSLASHRLTDQPTESAAFAPRYSAASVAWASETNVVIKRLTLDTNLPIHLLESSGIIQSLVFSPDGRFLATAGQTSVVKVYDVPTGRVIRECPNHEGWVTCVAFHPQTPELITTSDDGKVRLWNVTNAQPPAVLGEHAGVARFVLFNPNQPLAATGGDDHTIQLFDPRSTNGPISKLISGAVPLQAQFHPNGTALVCGNVDGSVSIWRLASTSHPSLKQLTLHHSPVRHVAFSADGNLLATGSDDGIAAVWDFQSGLALGPPLRHRGPVRKILFHPDSRHLATVTSNGEVMIWDSTTGLPTAEPLSTHGEILGGEFDWTGYRFLAFGVNGAWLCRFATLRDQTRVSPSLVADWSEAVAGQEVGSKSQFVNVPLERLIKLRTQLDAIQLRFLIGEDRTSPELPMP